MGLPASSPGLLDPSSARASAGDRAARVRYRRALMLMMMTLAVPGSAQLVAGNRRIGRIATRIWAALVTAALVGVVLAASHHEYVFWFVSDTTALGIVRLGLMSLAVGWALAVAVDFVPWLRRALTPLLVASQTLPIVAIAPLLIIWFGFGLLPKVVVIALVTFFPIAIGLIEGFAATDRQATNLLRSMGASRLDQFRYVRLPGAMPSFFTALRIGITYAVTGAIFAEYVGATAGLGIFMQVQKNSFRTDLVLAAVVVTAAVSVTLFALTFLVQRVVAPWSRR